MMKKLMYYNKIGIIRGTKMKKLKDLMMENAVWIGIIIL